MCVKGGMFDETTPVKDLMELSGNILECLSENSVLEGLQSSHTLF